MNGYKLRSLRENIGKTQQEMAELFNVKQTAYGKWELGDREPDHNVTKKIANFFGVSIDYLLDNDTDEKNTSPLPHEVKEVQEAMLNLSPDKRTKAVAILRGAFPEAFAKQNADEFIFTNVADAREFLVSQGALMFADTGVISDEDIIKIANEQWEKNR